MRINSSVFFESVVYRDVFPPYQKEWEDLDYVVTATYKTVAKQLRSRKVWDVALSIVLIVLANTSFLLGAIFAVFSVAFLDYCPAGCDSHSAVSIQFTAGALLALVGLVGTILTIVFLVLRRRGWWIALVTLVVIILGWIVSFLLYSAAVSYR